MMSYSEGTNKRGKVHYAGCDKSNESNPYTEWYSTACGLEYTDSHLTDDSQLVTCKNCLKRLNHERRHN